MSDIELLFLVRQAQAGSRSAFNQLVEQFEGTVFAICMRRLRNTAEASEVTQDVFVRMFRKLDQLREPERFVGWLKRIAVRLSINRAVRRPHETIQSPETFDSYKTKASVPIDGLVRQEQAREVSKGLSRLRKLDRETLLAFYFEGQSLKEMSDRFSSPVGTIKRRLHTARARLKEALGELQPA